MFLVVCCLFSVKNATAIIEKKLVVVIPSFNNALVYKKNLDSLFEQEYDNWEAIYIDDISPDNTGDLVEEYIKACGMGHKVKLIKNKVRSLAMANIYRAVHMCADDDIVLTLDGDDWFSHTKVLSLINELYQDPNVWLTYGSYIDWPEPEPEVIEHWMTNFGGFGNRPTPQHVIDNNSFRSFIGCTGQLRTFYAWLFKQIKLEDIMYNSDFFPMTYDVAMMVPMHEMAHGRFKYVSDIIYIHNLDTPLNDHKVDSQLQGNLEVLVRQKMQAYQPLSENKSGYMQPYINSKPDMVLFSYDRPLQLYATIESIEKYMTNVGKISVLYRTSNDLFERGYQEVRERFANVAFIKQGSSNSFRLLTIGALLASKNEHVIFSTDDILVTDYVNLNECIKAIEQTGAYGFYLRLGHNLSYCYPHKVEQPVPKNIFIRDNIYAWQFHCGTDDWNYPHMVDMTLYRKKDVLHFLQKIDFSGPNTMEGHWAEHKPLCSVGLCFDHSKVVNIPLNIVQTEGCDNPNMQRYTKYDLLGFFEQGFKFDINPLFRVNNISGHIDYEPTFIPRL